MNRLVFKGEKSDVRRITGCVVWQIADRSRDKTHTQKKDKWWCDAVCLVFFVFHPILGVKWRRFFITIRRRVLPMEYKQTWKRERNISLMHNAYSRFCASSAIWQHHERAPCMLLASRSLIIVIRAYIHSGWYSKDVIGRLLASPVNTSYVAAILGK